MLARLRLDTFGRLYAAGAVVLVTLILYLVQAAHVTQTSYEIERLRAQQADLLSERDQLRYREASMRAPARVEQEAQQAGMQRVAPSRFVAYRPAAVDLPPKPRAQPVEESGGRAAVAGILRTLGGNQDVLAATP